jgi:hypothetical protein
MVTAHTRGKAFKSSHAELRTCPFPAASSTSQHHIYMHTWCICEQERLAEMLELQRIVVSPAVCIGHSHGVISRLLRRIHGVGLLRTRSESQRVCWGRGRVLPFPCMHVSWQSITHHTQYDIERRLPVRMRRLPLTPYVSSSAHGAAGAASQDRRIIYVVQTSNIG